MTHSRVTLILLATLVGIGGLSMVESAPDFPIRLPDSVSGWTKGEDTVYTRETIYKYIDGGAELFLSYGFSSDLSRTYTRKGAPDIVVDIFDMGASKNAFGIFSHSRETIDQAFGQGSQYTKGLLLFWKDKYYVSVLASPETEESKAAVFELARQIDDAIPAKGPLPEILELLPTTALVEESIRYFHHYVWLNSHYFVADENILHIDEKTDAVLAKYKTGDKRSLLLIVEYPDESAALLARSDFVEHYLPEMAREPVVRIEDSTWTGCRLVGKVLAAVFNAPTKETATELLTKVEDKVASGPGQSGQPEAR
jgi:hypothetical protein